MTKRILAIRPRALGDVVLTEPALRALRCGHPGARLDVLTYPRYAPLLEPLPVVDRVISLPRESGAMPGLIGRLRGERYDLVVDFFGNPRSALLTAASGASGRAGYDVRGRRWAYRTIVPRNVPAPGERTEYAGASHVRLAGALGGVPDGVDVRLVLPDAARARARDALAAAGVTDPARTVGVVPAGTWATKTWPLSHFAVLVASLERAGWPVVAILGPGEESAGARLEALAPGVRRLPPLESTLVLAAAVAELAALVGTDSGPRHLAAAAGRPTFAWFGPADPAIWTPPDPRHGTWWSTVPCRACNLTRCVHWQCLPELSPRRAFELVAAHLARHVAHAPDLGPAARA